MKSPQQETNSKPRHRWLCVGVGCHVSTVRDPASFHDTVQTEPKYNRLRGVNYQQSFTASNKYSQPVLNWPILHTHKRLSRPSPAAYQWKLIQIVTVRFIHTSYAFSDINGVKAPMTNVTLIDCVKVLRPIRHKIGHIGVVLPSKSLGLVLKN